MKMTTYNVICDGPGPHVPADGVVAQADSDTVTGMRCGSGACVVPPAPADLTQPVVIDPAAIELLKTQVGKATTVAAVRSALLSVLDTLDPTTGE